MPIIHYIILIPGTILILWASRTSLRYPKGHGFYRFFAWESILVMLVLNLVYWFRDPFGLTQIISWVLLISSLLFLAWGIAFKRIVWYEISLAFLATIFLFITAKKEEAENVKYFGEAYRTYMKHTKMFIPFVL